MLRKPGQPMDARVLARVTEAIRAAGFDVADEPEVQTDPPNHNGTVWHYATWWVTGAHTDLQPDFYEYRAKQLADGLPWLVQKKQAEQAEQVTA